MNESTASTVVLPALPLPQWKDTYYTLHMWTQIVGKIRLTLSPKLNHWWQVPLYVNARGLTTSTIPYQQQNFEILFDFIDHQLVIHTSSGAIAHIALEPKSVAEFYQELMAVLQSLGIEVKIRALPDEVPNPIPFAEDRQHSSYDREYVERWWQILMQTDKIFKEFRARFIGKCSPVHFFWGSFDLAVTRFSGRRAPERAQTDAITREAYSHEVISHGFWTGSGPIQAPAFYSYTVPAPLGLDKELIRPHNAFYSAEMSEFILMYDDMRQAESPQRVLLEFMQSTYEAGANLANWDRQALER
ncbi:DUF5996 family protein [Aliterella atlantica]|uniref:Ava_C0101 and related proteins n=1 Tax=Aliterella atlantica CENA595 TaxID=1618023 RepID=A0A0D8ZVC3_9CYAN|nr:DUF5996 family protein [Aliterella atlantica]KJH72680.1 hypothetical protein UH38_06100 [Aliterella atlantica CENA595]